MTSEADDDTPPFLTSDLTKTEAVCPDSVHGSYGRSATCADRAVSKTLAQILLELAGAQHTKHPSQAAILDEWALRINLCPEFSIPMAIALTIDYLEDFERDERGRIIRLRIPADRIKNGAEIDKPVSVNLDRQIRAHLAWYRPHLTGSRSQWLFPSPHGGPLSLQAVIECVRAADPFDQIPGKLRRALHHAKQVRPVDRRNLVTGE